MGWANAHKICETEMTKADAKPQHPGMHSFCNRSGLRQEFKCRCEKLSRLAVVQSTMTNNQPVDLIKEKHYEPFLSEIAI